MFALIFPLVLSAAVLADAPPPVVTAAAPVAQAGAEVPALPVPSAIPVIAQAKTPLPVNAITSDICKGPISSQDLQNLPNFGGSRFEGFKSLLLQPCTLAPNEFSVSLGYENLTTVRGSHTSDRVFYPNALVEFGSLDPNLTFDLFIPTYSPGHTRDFLNDYGERETRSSEPGNSDLALGGTYRFDNRTSPFAIGFTGLAILPTSTRGSGTQTLGGITSLDVGMKFGPFDIDTSIAERFTTGEISPLSPYTILSGKGPSDKGASDCDYSSSYSYGSGSSYGTGSGVTTPISSFRDLRSDDRDKEYSTFNPTVTIGTWLPTFPTEPTFIYIGGSYYSQTSADPESSREAYHIGIVQPLSPRMKFDIDWGLSPSSDASRQAQHSLSTGIGFKF